MTCYWGEEILHWEEITFRPVEGPLPDAHFKGKSGRIGAFAETANLHNRRDENG